MIYMILNFVLCGILIPVSFSIDTRRGTKTNSSPLVNKILSLSAVFGMMGMTILSCFWFPMVITLLLGRLTFILAAWYSVGLCSYLMTFPGYEKTTRLSVIQWILNISAFIFVFLVPGTITGIDISMDGTFAIHSADIFEGVVIFNLFRAKYLYLFIFIYMFFIPLFTSLMVLVRAENATSTLDRQNMRIDVCAFVSSWLTFCIVAYATQYQPMLYSLSFVCFIPETVILLAGSQLSEIYKGKSIFKVIVKFVVKHLVPALIAAGIWIFTWPLFSDHPFWWGVSYVAALGVMITLWQISGKHMHKFDILRDSKYEKAFESDLASINYEGDTKEITEKLFGVFNRYCETSQLSILVDAGTGTLETVYSSNGKKYALNMESECFEKLLSVNRSVVFREHADSDYTIAVVRTDIKKILDSTDSDAFILLNEGRRIVGLICLGKKNNGNAYSEYDYSVFTKLYSNFFVVGYYMKNIVNESVVGTVNREIRMSGQIITSIQENMDLIKSPKVDVAYRMIPAHNIGGEFIDLIRLTETRHIFIVGALNSRGIAASMNMVILKSIIRTFLAETTDFKLLVEKVNSFIRFSLPKGTYFSGLFGLYDFKTDTMYYINCGIPALYLYTKAYNNVIEIQGEGHVLGFAKDVSSLIKVKKVKMNEGDIVMACTDGLIESTSLRGDEFGKERAQKAMIENTTFPADRMVQFEYDTLSKFVSKEIERDFTVLLIKHIGGK